MAFAPFDGVLLDDPRDPIPGAVAITLHFRVERTLAAWDKRPALKPQALRDRAAACQALLNQGLLPEQLRGLGKHGLPLGDPGDPRSLASLLRHLEAYLAAVNEQEWLEPAAALWRAAEAQRGFWVERQPEDGPLDAGLPELAPPRLRALCALPQLGAVRFRLAARRGAGRGGLFEGREPHLIRQLLPTLEGLAEERGLEHLELDAPAGWGENPWGEALDHLFEGPLALDAGARKALRRALLPTEAALWRGAVEQVCAWVEEGLAPSEITLVHPDPAGLGPLLAPLLAAEGIALSGCPGVALKGAATWGPLWSLLTGLRDLDPVSLAGGLAASSRSPVGRALRSLSVRLKRVDQTGAEPLQQALETLSEQDRHWVTDRWAFLWSLREKRQTPSAWLEDLEALVQRLELLEATASFYPALSLLGEAWSTEQAPLSFGECLEGFEHALEALRTPGAPVDPAGVRLLAPATLESSWEGARATLLLDLGEGAWPPAPVANPELDWSRLLQLNRALRAQSTAGEGCLDFPPHLQTFVLPQAEEGEVLPRAFHREAYRFNRALALTGECLVALSSERDVEGQRRAQGPFWHALEGAGDWAPAPDRAASLLRWRWEAGEPDTLTRGRQSALLAPETSVEQDLAPDLWSKGDSAETPLAPTLLEGLARCPFRVFAEKHLQLGAPDGEDAHILKLGTLAHRLMEALLGEVVGEPHWPAAFLERHGIEVPSASALLPLFLERWRRDGEGWRRAQGPTSAAETARLCLAVEELLPAMAEVLAEDLHQDLPTKDEAEFLEQPQEEGWRRELLGLELKLESQALDLPDGSRVWVHGTVDRLERWSSGAVRFLRIVDYKTSRYDSLRAYREEDGPLGAHLQLPLYQAMLEQAWGLPATALLVSLREPWRPVAMMIKGEDRLRLETRIAALLGRARGGDFPPVPGDCCATCGFAALCGRPVDLEPGEEGEP